jgi:hypothetical protein
MLYLLKPTGILVVGKIDSTGLVKKIQNTFKNTKSNYYDLTQKLVYDKKKDNMLGLVHHIVIKRDVNEPTTLYHPNLSFKIGCNEVPLIGLWKYNMYECKQKTILNISEYEFKY